MDALVVHQHDPVIEPAGRQEVEVHGPVEPVDQRYAVAKHDRVDLEDHLVDLRIQLSREQAAAAEPDVPSALSFQLSDDLGRVVVMPPYASVGGQVVSTREDVLAQVRVGARQSGV